MKNFAKKIALFLALALTLTLVDVNAVSAASKITLQNGKAVSSTVYANHKYDLKVAGTAVKFYSSNKSVATIGMNTGILKPVAPGTVKITAKSKKTGKAVATKTFKVLQRATAVAADQTELYLGAVADTATIKATLTPATSTDVVRFISADKTIATVGLTSGKVTAKAEGTTTVTVYAKATKATSNKSKYNKVATVNVFVGPYMASAVQKTATDIELTFKTDMKDVKAADFTVTNDTSKQVFPVKSAAISTTDTKVVTITTYGDIKDGATYTVSYGKTSAQFTATDGKVASLAIEPTVVTVGKETPIYVVAKDANGVQVAKYEKGAENLDFTVETSDGYVTGENALYLSSKTSTAKAKATLHTWKYETVDGVQKEVGAVETGEITITATDAESVSKFDYTVAKSAPAWNSASYKQNTTLCVGENDYNVYFKFADASNNELKDYTGYKFSSSNEDVLLVTSGLQADNSVAIAPIGAGTAYVIVKNATTDAVVTTLAVTVKDAAKATNLVLDKTTATVSNAAEANDIVKIGYKVVDQYNNKFTTTTLPTFEKKSAPKEAGDIIAIDESNITVNAASAVKGTYVYEIKYEKLAAKVLTIIVKEPATSGTIGFDLNLSATSMDAVVTDANSLNKAITINTVMTKGGIAYKALAEGANEGDGTTYSDVNVSVEVKNSKGEVVSSGNTFAVVTDGKAIATGTYTVVAKFEATKVADGKDATFTKTTSITVTNTQLPVTFERVSKKFEGNGELADVIKSCYSFYYDGTKYGKDGADIDVVATETSYVSETYVAFKNVTLNVPVADGVYAVITVDLTGYNTVNIEGTVGTTTETPATSEAPVETSEAPVETSEAPVETSEAPVETSEAPVETSEAPVETSEAPVETSEAPAEV